MRSKEMASGRVDIRQSKRDGKYRLRFYNVAEDQLETILLALRAARIQMGTDHDSVALDAMAMCLLASCTVDELT